MKKAITIALIIISFIIIYLLQQNMFSVITIYGVKPNLLVIFILFIGLFAGRKLGLTLGIMFGIYIDILTNKVIGPTALMMGIIGILGEWLDKSYSKESRLIIMFMVGLSTVIYELGIYIFNILKYHANIEIISFLKILLIEVLFNLIITIIIYPAIQKIGEILEETFKRKRLITKYF